MLIPRLSLRLLFAVTSLAAVVWFLLAQSSQEIPWAIGVSAPIVLLLVMFAVYAALFGVLWLLAQLVRMLGRGRTQSNR